MFQNHVQSLREVLNAGPFILMRMLVVAVSPIALHSHVYVFLEVVLSLNLLNLSFNFFFADLWSHFHEQK